MSYWFMGTGDFARLCLSHLAEWRLPARVVTAPPRPAGRGLKLKETPVAVEAKCLGLPLAPSGSVNSDEVLMALLREEVPQAIVVIDFGQMIRPPYLSTPPWGCLNVHPSLLPRYRGAAPLQRAIMAGDSETGVTVFRLVPKMDAGPILAQERERIAEKETYGTLMEKLANRGSQLLRDVLELLESSSVSTVEQDHGCATFAPVISKKETEIQWEREAEEIDRLVRALNPVPGAFSFAGKKRIKIWKADLVDDSGPSGTLLTPFDGCAVVACGSRALCLREVQPEGSKRLEGAAWWRGAGRKEGERLF